MTGQNPIAPYSLLNNATVSDAATYKSQIDSNSVAAARIVDQFLPHAFTAPTMGIQLDAGARFYGSTLTEVSGQSFLGITAAGAGNTRIDRLCVNAISGVGSYFTGTATAGIANPPALIPGYIPIAQISIGATTGQITNNLITDERWLAGQGTSGVSAATYGSTGPFNVTLDAFGRATSASAASQSSYLDTAFGSSHGQIIFRGASGWQALNPGTNLQVLQSGGPNADVSWVNTSNIMTALAVGSIISAKSTTADTAGTGVAASHLTAMIPANAESNANVATGDSLTGTWNPLTSNNGGLAPYQRTV